MNRVVDSVPLVEFGRFRLDRYRREFLADGRRIELGGRAFDTLLVLVDTSGTVVSKDELLRRIWPDRVVEENNLEIQISALRKALGADRHLIRTVPRRGYQFTGDIRVAGTLGETAASPTPIANLPAPVSELIGREAEIRDVMSLLTAHRLVTLTGVGGIGKTRLGLEVARQLVPAFPGGVFLADLAPLSNPRLVPVTVAAALNLTLVADAVSPERVAASVGQKRLLLVLDNCEHLVQAAARMAQAWLSASAGAGLLATSREPLRADGEYVYRVPALATPGEDADTEDVFRHDAVRLFVTRAQAAEPRFLPDVRIASAVAAICRRLDGMPLAIELAAARVASFGAEGIAARLDDRFTLLTSGSRTALPRHQTLRATLDWSHGLLSEGERRVLRRLAVFAGSFDLDAATAVTVGPGVPVDDVVDAVAGLVTRSLVSADVAGPVALYRLLETTRAYALEKLTESGERDQLARRHAEYHRTLGERTELAWGTRPPADWPAAYGRQIDNVRLALDWAFSSSGDPAVGVALTVATVPLWMHLALMTECRARAEQAMARLGPEVPSDSRRDMQLHLAFGIASLHTRTIGSPEIVAALAKALELAEILDDTEYRLRAMFGLYVHRIVTGDYRGALPVAEQFREVAARMAEPGEALIGARFVGILSHILGDQANARRLIEPLLGVDFSAARRLHIIRYQWDQRVVTQCNHARILWLQGFADQAMETTEGIVSYAREKDHVISLLYALFQAALPISVYAGDLMAAERYVKLVSDLAVKHALDAWSVSGQAFEGMLRIKRGESAAGARLLSAALDALPEAAFHVHLNMFRAELAEGLSGSGRIAEGLALMERAVSRAERIEEGWCFPELLRKKGELLLLSGAPTDAEGCFVRALDVARRQGALAWELRAATSIARLYHRQGRPGQGRKVLAPVYDRFTEGFGTTDLLDATALLAELR